MKVLPHNDTDQFPDYPAAHSQDARWFAIDERGQVAVFDTGENGPLAVYPDSQHWSQVYQGMDDWMTEMAGGDQEDLYGAMYSGAGVFYFDHDSYSDLIYPYQRLAVVPPASARLHVDQLPPLLREWCRNLCLSGVRFDEAESVQPLEVLDCELYSPQSQVAYLCSDGVTVRPVKGNEDAFAEFVRECREQNPALAETLRFEGPTDPDYPAAHSMDTTWFAVDGRGQVALFETGKNGPMPENHDNLFWDGVQGHLFEWARNSIGPRVLAELYATVGVTTFDYDDDYCGLVRLYQRSGTPVMPLHVDQLPPVFREAVRSVRMAGVRFDQVESLQVLDQVACRLYTPGYQLAYLCADGVTVRPIQGAEPAFAEFVREYHVRTPSIAESLSFEGPTDPDFPAAHSMDAYWFAVDERGQVAAFETGEDGHAPNTKDNDVFSDIYTLRFGPYDYDDDDGWDPVEWATLLGITFYRYPYTSDLLVLPYERTVVPAVPLHVDQLPHGLRWKCREVEFYMLSFAQFDTLQPMDVAGTLGVTFDFWYGEERPAYLCGDGMTVRPIRGEESRFAEFVRQHRHQYPEPYRFDGRTE